MTEDEEIRVGRLEGEVDILRQRLDDLINGMVDTIKNHPIWKHGEMSKIKDEEKDKIKCSEGPIQLFSPEGITKFLKLCDNLKYCMLEILECADQTDSVKDLKNRLKEATTWNVIFELSILGVKENIRQLEEKGDVEQGKELGK
jgi:hypothetical protein